MDTLSQEDYIWQGYYPITSNCIQLLKNIAEAIKDEDIMELPF